MSDEHRQLGDPPSDAETEPEEVKDEWIPYLETYEAALQAGASIPP